MKQNNIQNMNHLVFWLDVFPQKPQQVLYQQCSAVQNEIANKFTVKLQVMKVLEIGHIHRVHENCQLCLNDDTPYHTLLVLNPFISLPPVPG